MDFGTISRTEDLDRIQFELPPVEARSAHQLTSLRGRTGGSVSTQFYIGCPLWGQKNWVGKLYPPSTAPRDYLKYYARQMNSIELNTTFYRIPDPKMIQTWRQSVPSGFKFCPKFPRDISHAPSLVSSPELIRKFCSVVMSFEESLGMSFLQLPPHFDFGQMPTLWKFMEAVPRRMPLAIEFRHPSWMTQNALNPQVYDLLRERGVNCVMTDTSVRRDVLHGSITHDSIFVRFLGNSLHPTDYARLDQWIVRIGQWMEQGLQKVFFFLHQPNDELGPELVTYFVNGLNQRFSVGIKNWSPVVSEVQIELFA